MVISAKISKMITRMNSWIFTNSHYIWISRFKIFQNIGWIRKNPEIYPCYHCCYSPWKWQFRHQNENFEIFRNYANPDFGLLSPFWKYENFHGIVGDFTSSSWNWWRVRSDRLFSAWCQLGRIVCWWKTTISYVGSKNKCTLSIIYCTSLVKENWPVPSF